MPPPSSSTSSPSSTPDSRLSIHEGPTEESPPPFSYKHATPAEVFEDLQSRFIVNLPPDEIVAPERIAFQIEQAHWFYEDFVREENPRLKSYSMKDFTAALIRQSDVLAHFADNPIALYEKFLHYKSRVPVCGAIMLNEKWDSCILVRGYSKGAGWGFPKGKINEGEPPETCAAREVLEETGYDCKHQIDPRDRLTKNMRGQTITLFVVPNVPSAFEFQTRTRKEIGEIKWFRLVDLPGWNRHQNAVPGKFYLITPFISELQKFVHDRKPRKVAQPKAKSSPAPNRPPQYSDSSDTNSDHNRGPDTPSPQSSNLAPQVVVNTTNQIVPLPLSVLFDSAGGNKRQPADDMCHVPVSPSPAGATVISQCSPTLAVPDFSNLPLAPAPQPQPIHPQSRSPVSATSSVHSSSTHSSWSAASSAKALALLETVAHESAVMDRRFREQAATPSPSLRPAPAASVPLPSPLLYQQRAHDVLYSSSMGMHPASSTFLPYNDVTTTLAAPFARPSTSQMYQRPMGYPVPGSMSMSQSQIMDVMHSSHGGAYASRPSVSPRMIHAPPAARGGIYPPLSQPSFALPLGGAQHHHHHHHMTSIDGGSFPSGTHVYPSLPPLSAPAYPKAFPGSGSQPGGDRTASLLSILNGGI